MSSSARTTTTPQPNSSTSLLTTLSSSADSTRSTTSSTSESTTISAATSTTTTPSTTTSAGPSQPTSGVVTFDQYSLFVDGQRVIFFSGEFHPFRLPVPSLWRDIFEKIRALGYNGVSFYINWALLEGEQGQYRADGIFDLQPFFDAAKATGIFLLARPGPYINAEVSGGGFPGWLARNPGRARTSDQSYLAATELYMAQVGAMIAREQITNGGPVILVQPENEYTGGPAFPQVDYFEYVKTQLTNAGITVPLMNNDASPNGNFAPGKAGAVDIYGYDAYPLGFNCGNPTNWGTGSLSTAYGYYHGVQSPSTPHSIVEFQGGSFDPWGGVGFDKCAALLNFEFESVFYKNDISQGVKMLNLYMTYGGTNWGNLGHDSGYTSYDYGAVIAEDRTVARQKFSEAKLLANGLRAMPAYLTAVYQDNTNAAGAYTENPNVYVTGVFSNSTKFFVARQSAYYSTTSVSYSITLPTSKGTMTVPQKGGQLALDGRESKIHVTDLDVGGLLLLYSSAEVFTWQQNGGQRTLVLYGGDQQTHEFAMSGAGSATVLEGNNVTIASNPAATIVNLVVTGSRTIVRFSGGIDVHIVNRETAYNYWVVNSNPGMSNALPIVYADAGYLVRSVSLSGNRVDITGDLNATSSIEVLGVPNVGIITFNGKDIGARKDPITGILSGRAAFVAPSISLPDLSKAAWKVIDGLPEIQPGYDDTAWVAGSLTYTNNTNRPLDTPTSLYASDYGFHAGSLLYRGHFVSQGNEGQLQLSPQGGYGFGYTVWLNETYIGSWAGDGGDYYYYGTFALPQLIQGASYVFTVLIDHMGISEDYSVGSDSFKQPRGVMQYVLQNRDMSAISWKLTGNLGGESYFDVARGPLNEGGMFAERQGYHLPQAPTSNWNTSSPSQGLSDAGVSFYTTTFDLDLPEGYDIPLYLDFGSSSISSNAPHRVVMFVNGYQFGKYVSNIGPQTRYPVPEGIWNYRGSNTVAIELWAVGPQGASLQNLSLVAGDIVQSGYGSVTASPQPAWTQRVGAY